MGMEILFKYFASYRHGAADVMGIASDVEYRSLLDLFAHGGSRKFVIEQGDILDRQDILLCKVPNTWIMGLR